MAECHVQIVHNAIIGIQTLNLRITCTRHYPIEPLINLNCSLIHMVKMYIDKHTTASTNFSSELRASLLKKHIPEKSLKFWGNETFVVKNTNGRNI
jgi:hypothetical protein